MTAVVLCESVSATPRRRPEAIVDGLALASIGEVELARFGGGRTGGSPGLQPPDPLPAPAAWYPRTIQGSSIDHE
jgi:hypothetical protein